jgi:hypothetical protein
MQKKHKKQKTLAYHKTCMVSQKIKCRVTTGSSTSTPRYIPQRTENTYTHKNLYMNVHSNIISNSKIGSNSNVHSLMNA